MRLYPAIGVILLGACSPYPRDIDGTLDAVRQSRVLRVGLVAMEPADTARAQAFLKRVEAATGARAIASSGPAERQLALLEAGKLDLVLGEFARDSAWRDDVAVIEPLSFRVSGARKVGLAPVAANGENRWIMLLERTVREMNGTSRS